MYVCVCMLVHWTQGKISSVKYVFNKVTKRKEKWKKRNGKNQIKITMENTKQSKCLNYALIIHIYY